MLEKIKLALRYNSSIFDSEILIYVDACKADLKRSGVNENKLKDQDDPALLSTYIAYCKWMLNFQGEGEKWQKIYKLNQTSLVLDRSYTSV